MSKSALLTDTHWGIRGDNSKFHQYFARFYDEIFFPYLDEHRISSVIHLGDMMDRRKYMNIETADVVRREFFDPLDEAGISYHQIIGNHDTYFKNTNAINSFRMVHPTHPFYTEATEKVFGSAKVLFVPWICDQNYDHTMRMIDETDARIAMGHLEIAGFDMYKGVEAHGKMKADVFAKFDMVYSGHFHTPSQKGNIRYLGAAAQYTWSDYGDPRGFNVWDHDTGEVTFVENPLTIFEKAFYDDAVPFNLADIDFSRFKDKIVKVIVKNKNDPYLFDKYMVQMEKAGTIDCQPVDDHKRQDELSEHDIIDEAESTVDIFTKYIDYTDTQVPKPKLKELMTEVYHEALDLQ